MRKKKILFQSDYSLLRTGFGRVMKCLLTYLYKTGKYEILHHTCGFQKNNPELAKTPWPSFGTLPTDSQEIQRLNQDQMAMRSASYGNYAIDSVIEEHKPDLFINVGDIWSCSGVYDRSWFNKIHSVLWLTPDSIPMLDECIKQAEKSKNYFVWASFAEQELHKLGHNHVRTVHGPIETQSFKKLPNYKRAYLRERFNFPKETFVIGYVFRNQLRKSIPNLLDGFSRFKKNHPDCKNPRLLLHTSWSEPGGWNIHRLAKQYEVPLDEILTTYICRNCKEYEVKPFTGQDLDCKFCKAEKSQVTTNISFGVAEEQINEIYNLMDCVVSAFTSGGQEMVHNEALMTETPLCVTDYSCGKDFTVPESGVLALDYDIYTETQTEFLKASTNPTSIAKQVGKIFKMDAPTRAKLGKQGREWCIKNYSIEVIGKQFEDFFDSLPEINWSEIKSVEEKAKNPNAVIPVIENEEDWIVRLYKDILNMSVDKSDSGFQHWQNSIKNGVSRTEIEKYFRGVAAQENSKNQTVKFEDLLDNNGKKRLLVVCKESCGDVFLSTGLLESIKSENPDCDLYYCCDQQYFSILDGNPYIHKLIPYTPIVESEIAMTGMGKQTGFFSVYINLGISTQRQLNYLTNNNLALDLCT